MKKLFIGAMAIAAPLSLAACTTYDPYTGEQKVSNTAKGAGLGALAGAAIGAIAGDDEAALAGAAIGGVAGGAIGRRMDMQEQELRRELASTGVRVERYGNNIRLVMPGNITFATAQADIRPEFVPTLNSVSKVLDRYDDTAVLIEGHTDAVGSDQSNMSLSIRRAESVGNFLASRGVAIQRINALGYGEENPIAENTTEAGRAQNRRVEIQLSPLGA